MSGRETDRGREVRLGRMKRNVSIGSEIGSGGKSGLCTYSRPLTHDQMICTRAIGNKKESPQRVSLKEA